MDQEVAGAGPAGAARQLPADAGKVPEQAAAVGTGQVSNLTEPQEKEELSMGTDAARGKPELGGREHAYSEEVEIAGHIIDSLLLPKVLDEIMSLGGTFEIL